ncbi:MAG: hypothetical protein KGK07_14460 [Chloroflexota bacterium]|nr:hypothetical protein [Chloroflexota bacterium]
MSVYEAATRARDGEYGSDFAWHRNPVGVGEVRGVIRDATGFDGGDQFESEAQVREHFTPETMRDMGGEDAVTDPQILEAFATAVIEHRWHCTF